MKLTKSEVEVWEKTLRREEIKVGLAHLREDRMPTIARSPNPHEMAFDAGAVAGYTECLRHLKELAEFEPDEKSADRQGLELKSNPES